MEASASQSSPPATAPADAEQPGYRLWLRYAPPGSRAVETYRAAIRGISVLGGDSPWLAAARRELQTGLPSLLQRDVPLLDLVDAPGTVLVGTMASLPADAVRQLDDAPNDQGPEGFVIRAIGADGARRIVIASAGETGALYGVFHFLRLLQTGAPIDRVAVAQRPKLRRRILDHWDNLDGSIERGYAGRSLWKWDELPGKLDPRCTDYARACASIGINGSVLNNVNANPLSLSHDYLTKAAALADVFRPYGIRVYLSANFAAPKTLGKLPTADPLDPQVAAWWRAKADEIYQLIPDFGGFVVKANSEGQPGPQDYHRTHADGANVLADAVAPHNGIVMWRAFVYDEKVDPDRAKRAYIEFTALDGKFRDNVMVQVKNGPIDFMPREPFHPLFGAMTKTPVMAELQVTQEYLGHSKHLVYLATMWKEFLDADTHCNGAGSMVGRTIDASIYEHKLTGMCAVANTGADANWCGHHFAQANWYAFGRLAWDHELPAEHIADEWIRQTWTNDLATVETIRRMMMESRENLVNYSMPLGLHHLIGGDHYAPQPWNDTEPRRDWTATYYHQASRDGIGFDRTTRGNGAVSQYFPPVCDLFDSLDTCPENLLLWFHRLPWDHPMKSGGTLWDQIVAHYRDGAPRAAAMRETWASLKGKVDDARHAAVAAKLDIQSRDAAEWSDKCVAYFDAVRRGEWRKAE
jgi:alpha-glucuronidase